MRATRRSSGEAPHGFDALHGVNWLRVFRSAATCRIGPGGGQPLQTRAARSEKCVQLSDRAWVGMRMITMFFGPCAPALLLAYVSVFSHDFKRLGQLTKLATSSCFKLGNRQWSPASLLTPFAAGLYRLPFGPTAPPSREETAACSRKSAFLYVNPGLGTLGLPLRLGMPPEITVLTLRAAG